MEENTIKNYKKINIKFLFLFLFIALSVLSYSAPLFREGTSPTFELIDRESGLSNLAISSMVQDKYGFLWFGSQGGLNKYNGRKISHIRHNPFDEDGLVHNLIQTMYYDKENHELWLGTYQGISRYLIYENRFINYSVKEHGLSNSVIVAITKDNNGYFWAGTLEGLNRIDPNTSEIINYDIPGNVVRDMIIDSRNRLLIGTYEGLFYFDESKNKVVKLDIELPSPFVMVLEEYENEILTMGLWAGGIINYNMTTGETKNIIFEGNNNVYSLMKTSNDMLFAGTWGGGLYVIENDEVILHFPGEGIDKNISHPVIYSMIQDHTDIIWIGTNGGGINKLNPRKSNYVIYSYDPEVENSLSSGRINSILRDSKNNLWISLYNNGLNKINQNNEIKTYKNDPNDPKSLPTNSIVTIHESEELGILFGGHEGIVKYDYDSDTFEKINILPSDVLVYSIEEKDNYLWIGTYSHGVYKYNKENKQLTQYNYIDRHNYTISDNLIYDILIDSQDRLWIATNNGLNLLEKNENDFIVFRKVSGNREQLASNSMRTILEDSKGRIWIGTVGGGISLYNEDYTFKTFIEENGLSNNSISAILEGNDNRIWVATQQGISILDPETNEIYVLTPDDGIGGYEFNAGSFKENDGTLLFGGIHGITAIPYDFATVDLEPPLVYITDVQIFQNSLDKNKLFFNNENLKFGSKENFIGFSFVALDYDSPEKTTFSYKLEGFDQEWFHSGRRDYVSYSNLKPGNYVFHVVAETARGIKSEPVSFKFSIAAPWFRTYPAYIIYTLIFIFLIYTIFKFRENKIINEKNIELANINQKLEEAMKMKNVFISKITHDLKNPLSNALIMTQHIKESLKDEEDKENMVLIIHSLDLMLKLVEDLLDISNIESNNLVLQKRKFDFKNNFDELFNTFSYITLTKNNKMNLNYDEKIPNQIIGDKYRLNRVIQNLVSNSNKFTKDGVIDIEIKLLENKDNIVKIEFVVKDSGVGISKDKMKDIFKPYYQAHEFDGIGTGLGLSLCKELVELMDGEIKIESEKNKGTTVTFIINFEKA